MLNHPRKVRNVFIVCLIILLLGSTAVLVRKYVHAEPINIEQYRLSKPAPYRDSPYWSAEFVLEYRRVQIHISDNGYWVPDDFNGHWYKIKDGSRQIAGQPSQYQHTVWLFGNSGLFDPYVADGYTAADQLQQMLNSAGFKWRVVNRSAVGQVALGQLQWLTDTPIAPGDAVFFVDGWMDSDHISDAPTAAEKYQVAQSYRDVIARAAAYSKLHGAAFYHFLQPYQGDQPVEQVYPLISGDAPYIRVPSAMFIDAPHMNEHGDSIVAHTIFDALTVY